jgi:hypothetical protein
MVFPATLPPWRRHALRDAILDAYPREQDVDLFVTLNLSRTLDELTPAGSLDMRVWRLIDAVCAEGTAKTLYDAARADRPGNVRVKELALLMWATTPEETADVHVCFSLDDVGWVTDELLPRLRQEELSFTAARRTRNGQPVSDDFERALTSRRTVFVATQSFGRDFRAFLTDSGAYHDVVERRPDRLCVLLRDQDPQPRLFSSMPRQLATCSVSTGDESSWRQFFTVLADAPGKSSAPPPSSALPDADTRAPARSPAEVTGESYPHSPLLGILELAKRDRQMRAALRSFQTLFEDVGAQIGRIHRYKELHDYFQQLDSECRMLTVQLRWQPHWEAIYLVVARLQAVADALIDGAMTAGFTSSYAVWVDSLLQSVALAKDALAAEDLDGMKAALKTMTSLPCAPMSKVNFMLVKDVGTLKLPALLEALSEAQDILGETFSAHMELDRSIAVIGGLNHTIRARCFLHDAFQQFDDSLRHAEALFYLSTDALIDEWKRIFPRVSAICEDGGFAYAERVRQASQNLNKAIETGNRDALRDALEECQQAMGKAFEEIDRELLKICRRLREDVDSPLTALATLLERAA